MCEFLYSPDRTHHTTQPCARFCFSSIFFHFISPRVAKLKICFHSCGQLRNWKKKIQSLSLECISNWKFDESFFISTKWKGKVEKFDFVPRQNEKNEKTKTFGYGSSSFTISCLAAATLLVFAFISVHLSIRWSKFLHTRIWKRKKERNQLQTQITSTHYCRPAFAPYIYKCDYSISGLFKAEIST